MACAQLGPTQGCVCVCPSPEVPRSRVLRQGEGCVPRGLEDLWPDLPPTGLQHNPDSRLHGC